MGLNNLFPIFFKFNFLAFIFNTLPAGFEPATHCLEGTYPAELRKHLFIISDTISLNNLIKFFL